MRVLAFAFSASGQQSFVPEVDLTLVYAYSTGTASGALISSSPTEVSADYLAPGSNFLSNRALWLGGANAKTIGVQLNLPMFKDEKYFVSSAGAQTVIVYLNEVT